MDLQILNIYDHEGPTERVTFVVKKTCNLNQFIVINDNEQSDRFLKDNNSFFWFPNQIVKFDEWVRLFTGKGSYNATKEMRGGSLKVVHNFYWNSDKSIWSKNGDKAIVFHFNESEIHIVEKKDK